MLSVIMLNVIMQNVIMLNVIMLNVIMLSAIMLSVIMLIVVSPLSWTNTLAYRNSESITGVKCFMVLALGCICYP